MNLSDSHKKKKHIVFLIGCLLIFGSCAREDAGRLKIGDPAPLFEALDLEGDRVSLKAYRGNPVIIRFWSTDCKYCRADTPVFNDYFNKYKEKGLKVVYINTALDSREVREFVADLEIPFPVVLDSKGAIAESYNVKLMPQTIVLAPDHRIIAAILGGVSEAELRELVGSYLEQ